MLRLCGFAMVIAGAILMGFGLSGIVQKKVLLFRRLLMDLNEMQGELEFHLTPLPELYENLSNRSAGILSAVYADTASYMTNHPGSVPAEALASALQNHPLPASAESLLTDLFRGIGEQDAVIQSRTISRVMVLTERKLECLEREKQQRSRDCRIFCLCAGLAIAILFI